MPLLLLRVDERLIHGQVVVGWGAHLHPERIVVVDDELAASAWEQELYTLGLPPEVEAQFCSVAEARDALPGWREGRARTIVLIRDLATARRLAEGRRLAGEELNLGGIHFAPGRRELLPYLYLNSEEERELERLVGEGVVISARDLPGARRVELSELLRSNPRAR
jgi:PTS system mannose-specific IIB component/fructoselysine and glucoselysine-specific PTS system IIB component